MRKVTLRVAIGLSLAFAGYFFAATLGAVVPGKGGAPSSAAEIEVLLLAGPIHYDFLLPLAKETRDTFGDLRTHGLPMDHPEARWLLVGWGAKEFYTTTGSYRDVSFGAVSRAIFGDSSVMRVDVLPALHPDLNIPAVRLTSRQYAQFLSAIDAGFTRTSTGDRVALNKSGFRQSDRFFVSPDRFHLLRTCNTWIGRMLRSADLRFGIWVPLPNSVTLSHWIYQSR